MQLPNKHLLTLAFWAVGTYGLPRPASNEGGTGDGNPPQSNFAQGAIAAIVGGSLGSLFHSLGWGVTNKQGELSDLLRRRNQHLGQGGNQARPSPQVNREMSVSRGGPNPNNSPFHVPEMEPGWEGSQLAWELEVSQRRMKTKLGSKESELGAMLRCMEDELREDPYFAAAVKSPVQWVPLGDYLGMKLDPLMMYDILEIEDYCAEETRAESPAMAKRKAQRKEARERRGNQESQVAQQVAQRRRMLEEQGRRSQEEKRRRQQDNQEDDDHFWSRLDVGQAANRAVHAIAGQMEKSSGESMKSKGGPLNGVITPGLGAASRFKFAPL